MKFPRLLTAFLALSMAVSPLRAEEEDDFFSPVHEEKNRTHQQAPPRRSDDKRDVTVKVVPRGKVAMERGGAPAPVPTTRAYALQNIRAEELGFQIKQMLQSRAPKVTIGESLIVSGSEDILKLVTECISILDAEQPATNTTTPSSHVNKTREVVQTSFRIPEYRSPLEMTRNGRAPDQELEILQRETKSLRKVHAFFEEQVNAATKKLSKALADHDYDLEATARQELLVAVTDVFRARQRLQLNELREYSQRLQILRNNLITRERFADDLIKRHIAELAKNAETPSASAPLVELGGIEEEPQKQPVATAGQPQKSEPTAFDVFGNESPTDSKVLPLPNPANPLLQAPSKSPSTTNPASKPASLAAELARKLFDIEPSLPPSPASNVEPQWSTWWLPESLLPASPKPTELPSAISK